MLVITHEVTGLAIDRAEQKNHVVWIHWVVAKMEEGDRDNLGMQDQQANESLDIHWCDATREQFFGVFGEGIEAVERHKSTRRGLGIYRRSVML